MNEDNKIAVPEIPARITTQLENITQDMKDNIVPTPKIMYLMEYEDAEGESDALGLFDTLEIAKGAARFHMEWNFEGVVEPDKLPTEWVADTLHPKRMILPVTREDDPYNAFTSHYFITEHQVNVMSPVEYEGVTKNFDMNAHKAKDGNDA